jgi:hypothetical protein
MIEYNWHNSILRRSFGKQMYNTARKAGDPGSGLTTRDLPEGYSEN